MLPYETIRREEPGDQESLREYYELMRPLGEVFGQMGFGIRISPKAKSFYFDHRRREVVVSTRLIENRDLTTAEQKFVFLHEIGHLIQMAQDPDAYLEIFDIAQQKGDEAGDPRVGKMWGKFFNDMLDIFDNSIVIQRNPAYQRGGREEHLSLELYQKLFPQGDYSPAPKSLQFCHALLRGMMIPEERLRIDPQIQELLERERTLLGVQWNSLYDFVRDQLLNHRRNLTQVARVVKYFLSPFFEELLTEDIRDGNLPDDDDHDLEEGDIDALLDPKTAKELAEALKKARQSPTEQQEEGVRHHFEKWAQAQGISPQEFGRILEIQKMTGPISDSLSTLWEQFIQRESGLVLEESDRTFPTGTSVSGEALLANIPVLLTDPRKAEIYARHLPEEEREQIRPKKITLVLLVDVSGSMHEEKKKIAIVQEAMYSVIKSLIKFYRNSSLALEPYGEEFPVSVDYRMIGFGNKTQELLERTPEENRTGQKRDLPGVDLDQQLATATINISRTNLGGTEDAPALQIVEESISSQREEALKNGDEILIVLEMTDGETQTAKRTKETVARLNGRKNVFCRAIQIPGGNYREDLPKPDPTDPDSLRPPEVLPESGKFKEIWGTHGVRLEELEALKDAMAQILYDATQSAEL